MEKVSTIMILCLLAVATANDVDKSPEAVKSWFENLPNTKEKLVRLHFYFHDIVAGSNASAITVAEAKMSATSPTFFGVLRLMDNPLTVTPEPDSKIIGRGQGLYGFDSFEELGLLMTLNLVFTEGEFNGSTLSVLGHNPILNEYREMPIVGGSGLFRLARGVATAKTVWFNLTSQDAVVEWHVTVLYHVDSGSPSDK